MGARAIPVVRVVLPGSKPGKWIAPTVEQLDLLSVAISTHMRAIAMTDRGLRSPKLWKKITQRKWHPYMRQSINTTFRIENRMRMPARRLVSTPGSCFIARGTAFRAASKRLRWTAIVIWVEEQTEPWIRTDRPGSVGGGGVVVRAPLLDRDGIQGAQERGLAAA